MARAITSGYGKLSQVAFPLMRHPWLHRFAPLLLLALLAGAALLLHHELQAYHYVSLQ